MDNTNANIPPGSKKMVAEMAKELVQLSRTTMYPYDEYHVLFNMLQVKKPHGFGLDGNAALAVLNTAAWIAPQFNIQLSQATLTIAKYDAVMCTPPWALALARAVREEKYRFRYCFGDIKQRHPAHCRACGHKPACIVYSAIPPAAREEIEGEK